MGKPAGAGGWVGGVEGRPGGVAVILGGCECRVVGRSGRSYALQYHSTLDYKAAIDTGLCTDPAVYSGKHSYREGYAVLLSQPVALHKLLHVEAVCLRYSLVGSRKVYSMIIVSIGAEQRSLQDATPVWINEQVQRRRADGQPICARVSIQQGGLNMSLATPNCTSTQGGGRRPTPDENDLLRFGLIGGPMTHIFLEATSSPSLHNFGGSSPEPLWPVNDHGKTVFFILP